MREFGSELLIPIPNLERVEPAGDLTHVVRSSTNSPSQSGRPIVARRLDKRCLDFVGALAGIVLLAPLMLLVAICIRLDSRGPIFFRQKRLGLQGKPFVIFKFRSMVEDAEVNLRSFEHLNESEGGVLFKIKCDPRITRLGGFLRKSSLDELPQLFNVLRGQMSLVGPRPLQLRDCQLLEAANAEAFRTRLAVRPGVTGPWQVYCRSDSGFERMLSHDVEYVERWSMALDLTLISRTILVVFTRKGAY